MDVSTLKAGDQVAIERAGWSTNARHGIATVTKVSPTGQVTLSNGSRFNTNGWLIGGDKYDRIYLVELTDEIRSEVHRASLVRKIDAMTRRWGSLPTESLERVVAIIEEGKQ